MCISKFSPEGIDAGCFRGFFYEFMTIFKFNVIKINYIVPI
ncbi:hypothetical protein XBJ2_1300093 [Xenorhabdus bovienii str. Jollieti]|uniref:Uncharacterized protein n=1 Tax=Xenorhabdus bovienii (strain SS-2004) TaxID=406818 RepID=D3V1V4_XENBS|nr:hypothetical protein XBJ1_2524 [Xenorhabdus bovienii SS-2004]CDH27542.1 hypothetical protein XBJ2_1300093 [Xenorhabdus bovienii str. Jollieti]